MICHYLNRVYSFLFPKPCMSCGLLGEALCERCFKQLAFSPHLRVIDDLVVMSAMIYIKGGLLEGLIEPFKYKHEAALFRQFVPSMLEALRLMIGIENIIFVPVPLHPKRLKERGYNQSELLAKFLAKQTGNRLWKGLIRTKETSSQALTHSKKARQLNMQNAFQVSGPIPECGQIVLVDDIVTSGSTLLACKTALEASGLTQITALTLAERPLKKAYHRD